MQISKRQIDPEFESQIKRMFAQVIADITSTEKAQQFLNDFLTETEYMAMSKRLAIMKFLESGRSYEEIKSEIKVSSATIASIQSQLEQKPEGLGHALKLMKAEEWASKWAGRISGLFGKKGS